MTDMPSDSSRVRTIALVVSAVVLLLAVAGLGIWALVRAGAPAPKPRGFEPAQETTAAPLPGSVGSSSVAPSSTAETSAPESPSAEASSQPPMAPTVKRQRRVAFNLGGRLYVSDVSGANVTALTQASDLYSMSPDSTKLAVVAVPSGGTAGAGQIAVFDIATRVPVSVGSGAAGYPVAWSPDSSWFAYTAQRGDGLIIKRVQVDGSRDRVLAQPGAEPRVSGDGEHIAYRESGESGAGGPLKILKVDTKRKRAVPRGKRAMAWGWGPGNRLYFTVQAESPQDWDIWSHKAGADSSRKVGSVAIEAPAYALTDVRVSSDGKQVLLSAGGDDHYSRLWVFNTGAERFSAIQTRRDAYPCCWAGSNKILYFEGNTYQGEPSALASIKADGTGRRLIVTGAQR